jgi:hypothetical protein
MHLGIHSGMTVLEVRSIHPARLFWVFHAQPSHSIRTDDDDDRLDSFPHIRRDAAVVLRVGFGGQPEREHFPHINREVWDQLQS